MPSQDTRISFLQNPWPPCKKKHLSLQNGCAQRQKIMFKVGWPPSFCREKPSTRIPRMSRTKPSYEEVRFFRQAQPRLRAKRIARLRARDACEWFVRRIRASGSFEPKKVGTNLTQKNCSYKTVHFVEGFSLQSGCAQPTLNMIFWRWVHPFCSDRCVFQHGGNGFCRRNILGFLSGTPFCRENALCGRKKGGQAPPMKFQRGFI